MPQFRGSLARSRQRPLHESSPAAHWQIPPWQAKLIPGSHALPQPPQLSKLVLGSMQLPPHAICPAVGHKHWPPEHEVPAAQSLPQAPQLFGSFERFTHAPLQSTVLTAQVQVPAVQTLPVGQLPSVRQATQVLRIVSQYGVGVAHVVSLTQATQRFVVVLHTGRPATVEQLVFDVHSRHTLLMQNGEDGGQLPLLVQLGRQAPPMHCSPAAQVLPQVPQLFGSVWRFTQAPEQALCPDGHWQLPPTQDAPVAHALPQAPQLFASVCRSTHAPLHTVWPAIGQAQVPEVHVRGAAQASPQRPQLAALMRRSTQVPPHCTVPAGQAQFPFRQT